MLELRLFVNGSKVELIVPPVGKSGNYNIFVYDPNVEQTAPPIDVSQNCNTSYFVMDIISSRPKTERIGCKTSDE